MDSLIFELQIVFYFQLFLSANVRHSVVSKFHFLHEQQQPTMHLKYAEVFLIVLNQNMKLGDNTQNNERPS